jgi:hypothetical protein
MPKVLSRKLIHDVAFCLPASMPKIILNVPVSPGFARFRFGEMPGRPNRSALLASQAAAEEKTQAEDRFADALNELMGIDVYLLDPVSGVAFIPFQKDEELAWFVFDLFDSADLKTWRFHQDPLEMRRPITEVLGETVVSGAVTPVT